MPSTTANLEEGEVATERRREADGMWILLELLVGNSPLHSDLRTVNSHFPYWLDFGRELTGSSAAWIARYGIRIASTESLEEASR